MINIKLPATKKQLHSLKAGDIVHLSGIIYTARDAAHKQMHALLQENKPLPFAINDGAIYYAGPCPAPQGYATGSCGPTTSSRVDVFTPMLLDLGLSVMIGKGPRSKLVVDSIIKNKAVYFAAIGGCGALYAKCVKSSTVVAFSNLMSEAVHKFEIEDFPVVCAIDSSGNSIY